MGDELSCDGQKPANSKKMEMSGCEPSSSASQREPEWPEERKAAKAAEAKPNVCVFNAARAPDRTRLPTGTPPLRQPGVLRIPRQIPRAAAGARDASHTLVR